MFALFTSHFRCPVIFGRGITDRFLVHVPFYVFFHGAISSLRCFARPIPKLQNSHLNALSAELTARPGAREVYVQPASCNLCAGVRDNVLTRVTPSMLDFDTAADRQQVGVRCDYVAVNVFSRCRNPLPIIRGRSVRSIHLSICGEKRCARRQ